MMGEVDFWIIVTVNVSQQLTLHFRCEPDEFLSDDSIT